MTNNPYVLAIRNALFDPTVCTFDDILRSVSHSLNVPMSAILGRKRTTPVSLARHVTAYSAEKKLNEPLKKLGYLLGGRDHGTIIHSRNKVIQFLELECEEEGIDLLKELESYDPLNYKDLNYSLPTVIAIKYPAFVELIEKDRSLGLGVLLEVLCKDSGITMRDFLLKSGDSAISDAQTKYVNYATKYLRFSPYEIHTLVGLPKELIERKVDLLESLVKE